MQRITQFSVEVIERRKEEVENYGRRAREREEKKTQVAFEMHPINLLKVEFKTKK